ncbi:MAG: hypothetical protein Q9162_001790 [Coniocarpon cinnabarinum]
MDDALQPSETDIHGDNHFTQVAQKCWLNRNNKKAQPNVVKNELWDSLEKEDFPPESINLLENLQCLEQYLWPTFNDDSSNYHVLLIVLLLNVKRWQGLPTWSLFDDRPNEFSLLFRQILSLLLDTSLSLRIRTHVLICTIGAFQSLEHGLIRKECAPLVSISIWINLHSEVVRNKILEENVQFNKAWRSSTKRFKHADEAAKIRMRYERSWLYSLLVDFLEMTCKTGQSDEHARVYCERFMEFLCDIESQFPTRRYVNTLLKDMNILLVLRQSRICVGKAGSLMRDFTALLQHYIRFPLDDHSGRLRSAKEEADLHSAHISELQRIALKHFKERLNLLALSNQGALQQRQELLSHLEGLDDSEVEHLAQYLGIRTSYASVPSLICDRKFILELIITSYEKQSTYQQELKSLRVLPNESLLYDPTLQRDQVYDGEHPLAIPKLNLQYLATADFLWRSFVLYRNEAFYEIRTHLEETVTRLFPKRDASGVSQRPVGSRMAMRVSKPGIIGVTAPRVGEDVPAEVRAEIVLDVSRLPDHVRREWEELRADDTVFLVASKRPQQKPQTNGTTVSSSLEHAPFSAVRSAEVIQVLDENGVVLRHTEQQVNGWTRRPRRRRLIVKLDAIAYAEDLSNQQKGQGYIYESLDVVIRRGARENNFKSMLESIRWLAISDVPLPSWFLDVFLGLGDPTSANYKNLSSALKTLDFRDTFINWDHLREALPDKDIKVDGDGEEISKPPYVLETTSNLESPKQPRHKRVKSEQVVQESAASSHPATDKRELVDQKPLKTSKKRRREELEQEEAPETINVSTYKPRNMGPYPSDSAKPNEVRFTPRQVEAIISGTQPGLTVIVGPPGTGKTDVAVQIINNIYHNFPNERMLLVAHSNQALNQLFAKIARLDIDERHLLRLGQGERDLQLESSYGKQGRVENFLAHGSRLLADVNRLALSIRAPGAHGNSCETAEYFNSVYVRPIWKRYLETVAEAESATEIVQGFPFHDFFSNTPQPLFSLGMSKEQAMEVVTGCYRHIEKMFVELQDIQPFEVLRRDREKSNYLLVKEARIVAMTTTHAAMRRKEIADLGFRYDNVIMEEAAQITEVENFIPLAMQKASNESTEHGLKRVVLCGDHLQNSPIISNYAYRHFANLEQSMFLRLVRLGVPHILLDKQGRARESIAELYKWRYPQMGSLPHVLDQTEFQHANAGLRYDYQFVDVPDYKGKGESQPSSHFIQNLGEAEYIVALYQYMRLLGYPARKISILTMYAGQRALIRDVLGHRCKNNRLFGLPRTVSTVDKYQGEQNDYILLSLVRTARTGYLRDIRRLTVALSRARLGLYIFGRRSVFESCPELRPAFELLFQREDNLQLVTGEMFPTERQADDEAEPSEMDSVEHLGQYVFQMTQAKVKALREEGGQLPRIEQQVYAGGDEEEEDEAIEADGGVDGDDDEDSGFIPLDAGTDTGET